jgi:hydrogenase expression/formation protein HypC
VGGALDDDRSGVMCLAVPGKIISVAGDDPLLKTGRVDFGGIVKEVSLAYVPEAVLGDYVLVHVGFALTIIDAAEAKRVFQHLEEIASIEEELAVERTS